MLLGQCTLLNILYTCTTLAKLQYYNWALPLSKINILQRIREYIINLRPCMYSNPRTVIAENAPKIFIYNRSIQEMENLVCSIVKYYLTLLWTKRKIKMLAKLLSSLVHGAEYAEQKSKVVAAVWGDKLKCRTSHLAARMI